MVITMWLIKKNPLDLDWRRDLSHISREQIIAETFDFGYYNPYML